LFDGVAGTTTGGNLCILFGLQRVFLIAVYTGLPFITGVRSAAYYETEVPPR